MHLPIPTNATRRELVELNMLRIERGYWYANFRKKTR